MEHVTAVLGPQANAQQVFESLNSTGASLSGDELIHNYIHMGRSHAEQLGLERDVWLPIEQATAGATEEFWRDYLLLTSERQPDFSGDFGIYRSFRARFPSIRADLTPDGQLAASWLTYADLYGSILRPQSDAHQGVAEQLRLLQSFGGAPRPIVLGLLSRHQAGQVGTGDLLQLLEMVQAMFIRRAVVDLPRDFGIIGTLCREMMTGADLGEALTQRTPEDKPVRLRLSYQRPPQAAYVLSRLQNATDISDLHVEHIYPQTPTDSWAVAPDRTWGGLTNDEQSEYRMLLDTLGNLTLLEGPLNIAASNRSPGDKSNYYAQSHVTEVFSPGPALKV